MGYISHLLPVVNCIQNLEPHRLFWFTVRIRWLIHRFRVTKEFQSNKMQNMLLFLSFFVDSVKRIAFSLCEHDEIKVLLSHYYEPYVISGEISNGLDATILENFAQKYELPTKYIKTNASMPEERSLLTATNYIPDIHIIADGLG